LTAETYQDRYLGTSKIMTVPTRLLVMATGNNLQPVGDLSRRILISTIDHGVEQPSRLSFSFDPVARMRERWRVYRSAALTILRGFHVAGCPANGKGGVGSYEEWNRMIRQCVVWVRDQELAPFDLTDPADAVARNYEADPDTQKLTGLLQTWHQTFAGKAVTVADLIKSAQPSTSLVSGGEMPSVALQEVIMEIAGEGRNLNRRILGRWLEKRANRPVDGLRLTGAGRRSGVCLWKVVETDR